MAASRQTICSYRYSANPPLVGLLLLLLSGGAGAAEPLSDNWQIDTYVDLSGSSTYLVVNGQRHQSPEYRFRAGHRTLVAGIAVVCRSIYELRTGPAVRRRQLVDIRRLGDVRFSALGCIDHCRLCRHRVIRRRLDVCRRADVSATSGATRSLSRHWAKSAVMARPRLNSLIA